MKVTLIGSAQLEGNRFKHEKISSRRYSTFSESFKDNEADIILSIEQAQELIISLHNELSAEHRPTLARPRPR